RVLRRKVYPPSRRQAEKLFGYQSRFMEKVVDRDYPRGKGTAVSAKLALAALIALGGSAMAAEPYPDHPVTLIVPYAAGGSSDVLARLLGERWSKSLGQPIVIDNRAGAGSRLGIEVAAKSAPDGYTLLLADMPHTIIPAIQKGVRYDPVRDFTPIGLIGTASMFFFVNPAVKAETARDFVALAKTDPEKITIAWAVSAAPPTSPRSFFRPEPASSSYMCRFAAPARP